MNDRLIRILLVEDNPVDVELTLHALERQRLVNQVEVARDGAEAMDILFHEGPHAGRADDDVPHLVLLDLKLPRVDGLTVLRRVKSDPRTRRIPVVVLTTSREESDVVASYDLGVNSYITKPVDFDQFAECVRVLGLYWALLNEPPAVP